MTATFTWRSQKYRDGSHSASLLFSDGNLIVMDVPDGAIWSSNTASQGYQQVTITDNGQLVLIKADGTLKIIPSG